MLLSDWRLTPNLAAIPGLVKHPKCLQAAKKGSEGPTETPINTELCVVTGNEKVKM